METKMMPVSKLHVSLDFNSRKYISGIDHLAKDIGTNGLMNPVIVTRDVIPAGKTGEGLHLCIAGNRRLLAVMKLGWKEIAVQLMDVKPFSKEAALANCRENFARHDLTPYDTSRAILTLMEIHKMTDRQIAEEFKSSFNLSHKHINNLVLAQRRLHPTILTAWADQHELATTTFMFKLAPLAQHLQEERWLEAIKSRGVSVDAEETRQIIARQKKEEAERKEAERAEAKRLGIEPIKRIHRPNEEERTVALGLLNATEGISGEIKEAVKSALLWIEGNPSDLTIAGQLVFSPEAAKLAKREAEKAVKKKAKEDELTMLKAKLAEYEAKLGAATLTEETPTKEAPKSRRK